MRCLLILFLAHGWSVGDKMPKQGATALTLKVPAVPQGEAIDFSSSSSWITQPSDGASVLIDLSNNNCEPGTEQYYLLVTGSTPQLASFSITTTAPSNCHTLVRLSTGSTLSASQVSVGAGATLVLDDGAVVQWYPLFNL